MPIFDFKWTHHRRSHSWNHSSFLFFFFWLLFWKSISPRPLRIEQHFVSNRATKKESKNARNKFRKPYQMCTTENNIYIYLLPTVCCYVMLTLICRYVTRMAVMHLGYYANGKIKNHARTNPAERERDRERAGHLNKICFYLRSTCEHSPVLVQKYLLLLLFVLLVKIVAPNTRYIVLYYIHPFGANITQSDRQSETDRERDVIFIEKQTTAHTIRLELLR